MIIKLDDARLVDHALSHRRAASLLSILEAEGPNIRFLRAFGDAPRQVRRLVVRWLALGWPGGGRR
jgi:hypothetical protein